MIFKSAEDCGFKITKPGGLFSKMTREGVSASLGRWITDGRIGLDLGGERERWQPEQWRSRRGTMAGGKEVTDARGLGATGHGSTNRGHRGREGVRANSPRPRERPEDAAEVEVAMAGGGKVDGARGLGARGHEMRNKRHGEKEGSKGVSPREKTEAEAARGRRTTRRF